MDFGRLCWSTPADTHGRFTVVFALLLILDLDANRRICLNKHSIISLRSGYPPLRAVPRLMPETLPLSDAKPWTLPDRVLVPEDWYDVFAKVESRRVRNTLTPRGLPGMPSDDLRGVPPMDGQSGSAHRRMHLISKSRFHPYVSFSCDDPGNLSYT